MGMFCYQCEQAAKGTGCDTHGVCGKSPEVAALQDIIIHQLKGIGFYAHELNLQGVTFDAADRYVIEALFTTVTNVNFDEDRLEEVIYAGAGILDKIRRLHDDVVPVEKRSAAPAAAQFKPSETTDELIEQAVDFGVLAGQADPDLRSLRQLLLYGLKGMGAYADHALLLGKTDPAVFRFFHEALAALATDSTSMETLIDLCMRCGTVNIRAMEILDEANTGRFGHPQPTPVGTGYRKGPAIVVTGHDLLDLEELLKQTEGSGVNVYTHGEMLPAHGYPGLKKYKHLAGHFGTAWQNQQKEFDGVTAAFLFTTNCIQKPRSSYVDRVFTTGLVAFSGVAHVKDHDFSIVIAKAKSLGGFEETPGKSLMTGFARNAVLGVADQVVAAVKSGAIKHFFLVGGCDGTKPGRNYYTEFVEKTPKDTVILTLACGKFRFNHLDLGTIGGIPRLLDVGQCNDAYSAIKIAEALAGAFGCGVNELPLSLILSWYEQKAVVILLSLLSLGIRGIRLGPSLPAFISPNILKFLVEKFDVKPISTAQADLDAILVK
jgi:hydroxylamine reductase